MSPIATVSPAFTSQTMRRLTSPRDLYGHHFLSFRRADQHTVAFIVRTCRRQIRGMETTGPVAHGDHIAADRGALHMGVQDRQEDADPGQRAGVQAQFGQRFGLLRPANQPVGRATTTPGGSARVRSGCRKNAALAPAAASPARHSHGSTAQRGDREPPRRTADRQGCMGGTDERTSATSHEGRTCWRRPRAGSGHRRDSTGGHRGQVPQRDLFTGGDRGDVLRYLQRAVCRCQPAQMVRRRGP